MTGLAAVFAWPLDRVGADARTIAAAADRVLAGVQTAEQAMDRDPEWTGATHDAAGRRIGVEAARGDRLVRTLDKVATAAQKACDQLVPARAALQQQVGVAQVEGFTVHDDGTVEHPDAARKADAEYLQDSILGLLNKVRAADKAYAAQLTTLAGLLKGDGTTLPHPSGGFGPPGAVIPTLRSLTPDGVRRYWDSLTPAERKKLIEADPKTVGNLSGVPLDDRAVANDAGIRAALRDERLHGRGDGKVAKDLEDLLKPVDDGTGAKKPRKFVAFEMTGRGHYIEMIGDLKPGAKGAGVYVPGTGSGLTSNLGDRKRAAALSSSSGAPVFLYVNSDLPKNLVNVPKPKAEDLIKLPVLAGLSMPLPAAAVQGLTIPMSTYPILHNSAADAGLAKAMAPGLVQFGRDLDAEIAARAPGVKTTVIGHSYGGSVVGTAEQLGLRADNVVYASSAGTGAGDGPWRNPQHDVHRYTLTAPGDLIHVAQKLGGVVHGGDPKDAPGVQQIPTGHYSPHDGKPGEVIQGNAGHSGYLDDPGSDAFKNIAKVLGGDKPELCTPDAKQPGCQR
ncbi:MAG: alpha/beta hydrolase [Gordonia sp. (in: high G+C Gram-positive bacteria)]